MEPLEIKKAEFVINWHESDFKNLLNVIEYSVTYINNITKDDEATIGVIYGPDTKYEKEFKKTLSPNYKILSSNSWTNGLFIGNKYHWIRLIIK